MNKIYISPSQQCNNVGYSNYGTEQKRMFEVGKALKIILERCKQTAYIPKIGITFQQAVKESNDLKCDIHLPIHSNAFNKEVRGTQTMYVSNGGKILSDLIYAQLSAFTPVVDRGSRKVTNLYELNATHAVCAYTEIAFHDNKEDAELIMNNIEHIAELIARGVCAYLKVAYVAKQVTASIDTLVIEAVNVLIKQVIKPVEKPINIVLETQKFLNSLWVTDSKGNKLVEDGIMGANTLYSYDKLRGIINE